MEVRSICNELKACFFIVSDLDIAFSMANPFSLELSMSGGLQHLYTNNDLFSNNAREYTAVSSDSYFIQASLKPEIKCLYKNTGLYASIQKPIGDIRFKRYFILSGGLMQRINISEKSALDFHLGTTWHSVNEAIHSFMMFIIYTHYRSVPGLDAGLSYNYKLSDHVTLFGELNFNYNEHYIDNIEFGTDFYPMEQFRTISLSIGVTYSMFGN